MLSFYQVIYGIFLMLSINMVLELYGSIDTVLVHRIVLRVLLNYVNYFSNQH